jgi:hypothetical protein
LKTDFEYIKHIFSESLIQKSWVNKTIGWFENYEATNGCMDMVLKSRSDDATQHSIVNLIPRAII